MISKSIEETKRIAEKFLSEILIQPARENATIVALSGDLGSGKTTFTQQIALLLGIKDQVISPTFVIEKIYKIDTTAFTHLIHIDAYRIEDDNELGALGFEQIISNPKNLVFIEWPERISKSIPENAITISFIHKDESTREIIFKT